MLRSERFCLGWSLVVLVGLGSGACSGGDQDACEGWTCSGHGICKVSGGQPACECDAFFVPSEDGSQCLSVVLDPCQPYDCAGHGRCQLDAQQQPYCTCEAGWFPSADRLDCIENQCQVDCGPIGCCGLRCCRALPSNSVVLGALADNGLSRTASGSFDTDSQCSAGSALGDCQRVAVPAGVEVCVCRLDQLTIQSLRVTGQAGLAVLAWCTIRVDGAVDLAATGERSGPGAIGQDDVEAATWRGGKGGSNGTLGGNSGDPAGPAALIPLVGGQVGQDGCGGSPGGGAGGALQLVAGESITVSGQVSAGGGGGVGGQTDPDRQSPCIGGAGGGSGGSLLLEAPMVTYSGAFYANGGSGGGGGNNTGSSGENGRDARAGTDPVLGGQGRDGAGCALYQNIEGGDGGAGSAGGSVGADGQDYDSNQCPDLFPFVGGGGGGGAAGRLRVNALEDCACNGTFSPPPSFGYLQGG